MFRRYFMASTKEVRQYLAHWFQLGKAIDLGNGQTIRPQHVFHGTDYTNEFEECWQQILANQDCYLAGTEQTIADLLSARWDLAACSRCTMPTPLPAVGLPPSHSCTCSDLSNWPSNQVPMPRSPEHVSVKMTDLRQRLAAINRA